MFVSFLGTALAVPTGLQTLKEAAPLGSLLRRFCLNSSCCLDAVILEMSAELIFKVPKGCESHLTWIPHPGEFKEALR